MSFMFWFPWAQLISTDSSSWKGAVLEFNFLKSLTALFAIILTLNYIFGKRRHNFSLAVERYLLDFILFRLIWDYSKFTVSCLLKLSWREAEMVFIHINGNQLNFKFNFLCHDMKLLKQNYKKIFPSHSHN